VLTFQDLKAVWGQTGSQRAFLDCFANDRTWPAVIGASGHNPTHADGLPVALLSAGEVHFLEPLDVAGAWAACKALLRKPAAVIPNSGVQGG
jgi:hypothetical protein